MCTCVSESLNNLWRWWGTAHVHRLHLWPLLIRIVAVHEISDFLLLWVCRRFNAGGRVGRKKEAHMDQFYTSNIAFYFRKMQDGDFCGCNRRIWLERANKFEDRQILAVHDRSASKPEVTKFKVSPEEEMGTDYGKMHYCMILVLCRYCRLSHKWLPALCTGVEF